MKINKSLGKERTPAAVAVAKSFSCSPLFHLSIGNFHSGPYRNEYRGPRSRLASRNYEIKIIPTTPFQGKSSQDQKHQDRAIKQDIAPSSSQYPLPRIQNQNVYLQPPRVPWSSRRPPRCWSLPSAHYQSAQSAMCKARARTGPQA
jgi:hypothetical protein